MYHFDVLWNLGGDILSRKEEVNNKLFIFCGFVASCEIKTRRFLGTIDD